MSAARDLLPNVNFASDPYDAAEGADALVIVTEWSAFRALDMKQIGLHLKSPVIVDLRNIYSRQEIEQNGLKYYGVGR